MSARLTDAGNRVVKRKNSARLLRLLKQHHGETLPSERPKIKFRKVVPLPTEATIEASSDRYPKLETIIRTVAEFYEIPLNDIRSARRHNAVVRPRMVAYFLCKELTLRSLPEIGRRIGGRDHTTILSGCNRIREWLDGGDERLADELAVLRLKISERCLNKSEAA